MQKLSQLIKDRLTQSSEVMADLLKFCRLQIVIVQQQSALQISCPNNWTEKQLCDRLFSNDLAKLLHSMGVEAVILYNDENWKFYYCYNFKWDLHSFDFRGYFIYGDLSKLKLVEVPSIEQLEQWADEQQ